MFRLSCTVEENEVFLSLLSTHESVGPAQEFSILLIVQSTAVVDSMGNCFLLQLGDVLSRNLADARKDHQVTLSLICSLLEKLRFVHNRPVALTVQFPLLGSFILLLIEIQSLRLLFGKLSVQMFFVPGVVIAAVASSGTTTLATDG